MTFPVNLQEMKISKGEILYKDAAGTIFVDYQSTAIVGDYQGMTEPTAKKNKLLEKKILEYQSHSGKIQILLSVMLRREKILDYLAYSGEETYQLYIPATLVRLTCKMKYYRT